MGSEKCYCDYRKEAGQGGRGQEDGIKSSPEIGLGICSKVARTAAQIEPRVRLALAIRLGDVRYGPIK